MQNELPYLRQRPLYILDVLRVHRPHAVEALCNLIDVDADLLYLGGLCPDVGSVHVDDIAVNEHLPGVGRKVLRVQQHHFLFDQLPFLLRHGNAQHDLSFSVCHDSPSFMWVIVALAIIATIILLTGKGSMLVSGFNTKSPEERAKYDKKKVSKQAGSIMVFVDIGLLALTSYIHFRAIPAIQNNTISDYGTEITIVALGICIYIIVIGILHIFHNSRQ